MAQGQIGEALLGSLKGRDNWQLSLFTSSINGKECDDAENTHAHTHLGLKPHSYVQIMRIIAPKHSSLFRVNLSMFNFRCHYYYFNIEVEFTQIWSTEVNEFWRHYVHPYNHLLQSRHMRTFWSPQKVSSCPLVVISHSLSPNAYFDPERRGYRDQIGILLY